MKVKSLFLIGLMSISFIVNAQKEKPKTRDVYCQIVVQQKFMSKNMKMYVDYGEQSSFWIGHYAKVRDEQSGKVKKFNSQIDALNYMTEEGWSYVSSHIIAVSSGLGTQLQYFYLLKREIPFEGL